MGSDIEEAAEFALHIGQAGEVLRQAKENLTDLKKELIRNEIRSYFERGQRFKWNLVAYVCVGY